MRPRRAFAVVATVLALALPGTVRAGDPPDDLALANALVGRGLDDAALGVLERIATLTTRGRITKARALAGQARSEKDADKRARLLADARRVLQDAAKDGASDAESALRELDRGHLAAEPSKITSPPDEADLARRLVERGFLDGAEAVLDRLAREGDAKAGSESIALLGKAEVAVARADAEGASDLQRREALAAARALYEKALAAAKEPALIAIARCGAYEARLAGALRVDQEAREAPLREAEEDLARDIERAGQDDDALLLASYYAGRTAAFRAMATGYGEARKTVLERARTRLAGVVARWGGRVLAFEAAVDLGLVLVELGRTDEARRSFESALSLEALIPREPTPGTSSHARANEVPPVVGAVLARGALGLALVDRDKAADAALGHALDVAFRLPRGLVGLVESERARVEAKSSPAIFPSGLLKLQPALARRPRSRVGFLDTVLGLGSPEPERFLGRADRRARAANGGETAPGLAVAAGLDWLARHQSKDGAWCGEGSSEKQWDVGLTALGALALLGAGETPGGGSPHAGALDKALAWLAAQEQETGQIGPSTYEMMYGQALATLAFAEAYGVTRAWEPWGERTKRAADFIVYVQNHGLGWRYTPKCGSNDSSVTGWCVRALATARAAGVCVDPRSLPSARAWFERVTDGNGEVGYDKLGSGKLYVPGKNEDWAHHPTMTAIGLDARLAFGVDRKDPVLAKGLALVLADLPTRDAAAKEKPVDFYAWHHETLAVFELDGPTGKDWKRWNTALLDALLPLQRTAKDGEAVAGSWDPEADRWGYAGGRIYATALNVLTLATPWRGSPPPAKSPPR